MATAEKVKAAEVETVDILKVVRRIKDALHKTATAEQILQIAKILSVRTSDAHRE